jgi:stage II sporulation protein D
MPGLRTVRRAFLVSLLAMLFLAPACKASVTWIVRGHGFGHGVGMSQYGAYGFASHGKDYRFILAHYYSGTTLGQLSGPQIVRVLLAISSGDIGFRGATSACGRTLEPGRGYAAHRAGSIVKLRNAAGRPLADCGRRLRATGDGRIEVDGAGVYRGALEVVTTDSDAGSLNAINALPVDQYVRGVVANESPASWPQAALRAQAVAARSYALSVQVEGNGFDLYNDTRSQVYGGVESETEATDTAANATKGQVLTYEGEIAQTYFSACSGGHTESVQNVFFGTANPYLVGVPDPYDYYCPLHSWTLRFSGPEISARLSGYLKGRLKQVVVTQRGASPRILWARLYGTGGVSKIRGDQLASALGAYDRWMRFEKVASGQQGGLKTRPSPATGAGPETGS